MDLARLSTRIWLGLFVLDAGVGVLQATLALVGVGSAMGWLAGWTELLLFLGTTVYFMVWVGTPRAPWWALGVLAFLVWQGGGLLPLPAVFLDLEQSARCGALLQAIVAVPLVVAVLTGRLLGASVEHPRLLGLVRGLVLVVFALIGMMIQIVLVGQSLRIATGGFARVDLVGMEMGHRTCTRADGAIVHLVGAVHVGEAEGYDALLADIPSDALMLAEGVTDEEGLLGSFSYDKLAGTLGLVPQRPSQSEPGSVQAEGEGRFRVRRADVDVSAFDPLTLDLLSKVGEALESEDPMGAWLRKSAEIDVGDGLLEALLDDILWSRNAALLAALDEELVNEGRLLVPWGALHLRGIRDGVEDRGFDCGRPEYVRMLRWSTVRKAVWKR